MRILVIIPTYNEAENIRDLIPQVLKQNEYIGSSNSIDVLVVDDNSPDGTAEVVKELQSEFPGKVYLIQRPGKLGLGTAYVEGFKFALKNGYDFVFEMDADFSHNPNEIPNLFNKALEGYDFVIGSRYSHGISVINWPIRRVLLSYFANTYARLFTGVPVRDLTSGFKCISKKVFEKVDLDIIRSNGYAFQIELTTRAYYEGFKIVEHPIIFVERRVGVSKLNRRVIGEAVWMVLRLSLLRFKKIFKRRKDGH
jgi:dolichol-phosphate mannosyltransferase